MEKCENLTGVAEAERWLDALVLNARQQGHADPLASVASKVGTTRWAIWGFTKGRRKEVASWLLDNIRKAYLELCMSQVRHLEAEMADLRRKRGGNETIVTLGDAVSRLVEQVREARERNRGA